MRFCKECDRYTIDEKYKRICFCCRNRRVLKKYKIGKKLNPIKGINSITE